MSNETVLAHDAYIEEKGLNLDLFPDNIQVQFDTIADLIEECENNWTDENWAKVDNASKAVLVDIKAWEAEEIAKAQANEAAEKEKAEKEKAKAQEASEPSPAPATEPTPSPAPNPEPAPPAQEPSTEKEDDNFGGWGLGTHNW